jgi:hypothetical protein
MSVAVAILLVFISRNCILTESRVLTHEHKRSSRKDNSFAIEITKNIVRHTPIYTCRLRGQWLIFEMFYANKKEHYICYFCW